MLRENPDVIAAGELRDHETISLALNAAESGHFVIAPLHSGNSEEAIYRKLKITLNHLPHFGFHLFEQISALHEAYYRVDIIREDAVSVEVRNHVANGPVCSQSSSPRLQIREKVQGLGAAQQLDGYDELGISDYFPALAGGKSTHRHNVFLVGRSWDGINAGGMCEHLVFRNKRCRRVLGYHEA